MPLSYLIFSEEDILNQVAADGWQLVNVIMTEPGSLIVYLKRTRQETFIAFSDPGKLSGINV